MKIPMVREKDRKNIRNSHVIAITFTHNTFYYSIQTCLNYSNTKKAKVTL